MSFQAMAWAYIQRPVDASGCSAAHQHHVLLGLANYATSEGQDEAVTFVGCKKLAEELCTSERSIRRAVEALEEQGLVSSERRRREDGTWSTSTYSLPTGRDVLRSTTGRDVRRLKAKPQDEMSGPPPDEMSAQEPQARTSTPKLVQPQALAPTSSSRPVDPIFEELFMLETLQVYSPEAAKILTPPARSAINKAAADIRRTGISREDLHDAIGAWGSVMGDATCTANAIAKHLPRLVAAANGNVARARQPSDEDKVLAELRRRREEKEAMDG